MAPVQQALPSSQKPYARGHSEKCPFIHRWHFVLNRVPECCSGRGRERSGPSQGKPAASRTTQKQDGCAGSQFLCTSAAHVQVSSRTATVCPPCPADEPYGTSSCRKAEDWKGLGSAVLGHSWEASSTELLTTGIREDSSHKLSSALPEGLLKEGYSEHKKADSKGARFK